MSQPQTPRLPSSPPPVFAALHRQRFTVLSFLLATSTVLTTYRWFKQSRNHDRTMIRIAELQREIEAENKLISQVPSLQSIRDSATEPADRKVLDEIIERRNQFAAADVSVAPAVSSTSPPLPLPPPPPPSAKHADVPVNTAHRRVLI